MSIPSLNKVVSLFLVGGLALVFALAFVGVAWWKELQPLVDGASNGAIAIASALSLPLAGAAGVVVDAIAHILFRRPLRATSTKPGRQGFALFFRQDDDFTSFDRWRESFVIAHKTFLAKRPDCPEEFDSRVTAKDIAAGLFLRHAPPQLFEWVTSHYAMYYLATSSCVVLVAGMLFPIRLLIAHPHSPTGLMLFVAILLFVVVSLIFAVDRYLYTYESVFRFSTQWLYDEVRKAPPATTADREL